MVEKVVTGSRVTYASGASADARCYRVDCEKLPALIPDARPQWTVQRGIEALHQEYKEQGLTLDVFLDRYVRIKRIKELMDTQALDSALRWNAREPVTAGGSE
jgi:hypothetical protein